MPFIKKETLGKVNVRELTTFLGLAGIVMFLPLATLASAVSYEIEDPIATIHYLFKIFFGLLLIFYLFIILRLLLTKKDQIKKIKVLGISAISLALSLIPIYFLIFFSYVMHVSMTMGDVIFSGINQDNNFFIINKAVNYLLIFISIIILTSNIYCFSLYKQEKNDQEKKIKYLKIINYLLLLVIFISYLYYWFNFYRYF